MDLYEFLLGLVILSFLVPASLEDIRSRTVDVRLVAVFSVIVPVLILFGNGKLVPPERLLGLGVGLVFLLISHASGNAVGRGDALTLIWLGYSAGFTVLVSVLLPALGIAFIWAVYMSFRKKKGRIAFIPLLSISFLAVFAENLRRLAI